MELDKGNGSQLLAELLQYNHPLQQGHVVDVQTLWFEAKQSLSYQQEFGCEVWDALNPQHEVPNHPDDDGEEGPAAGAQVDVGIQQVLMNVWVG